MTDHATKTAQSLAAVKAMEAGLVNAETDMTPYFTPDFVWRGNRGCGTKNGLDEFRRNWQKPIRSAFTDRDYKTDHFMADGEWAACFGHIEATHSGTFMGIAPTGKRIEIRYMDFWKVSDGKIEDNWVMVDFPHVLAQLGVDVFNGEGWEAFDRGDRVAPKPPDDGKAQ